MVVAFLRGCTEGKVVKTVGISVVDGELVVVFMVVVDSFTAIFIIVDGAVVVVSLGFGVAVVVVGGAVVAIVGLDVDVVTLA